VNFCGGGNSPFLFLFHSVPSNMVKGTFWENFPKKLQHFEEEKCFEIIKIFGGFG
jgi:hypothetical protein